MQSPLSILRNINYLQIGYHLPFLKSRSISLTRPLVFLGKALCYMLLSSGYSMKCRTSGIVGSINICWLIHKPLYKYVQQHLEDYHLEYSRIKLVFPLILRSWDFKGREDLGTHYVTLLLFREITERAQQVN